MGRYIPTVHNYLQKVRAIGFARKRKLRHRDVRAIMDEESLNALPMDAQRTEEHRFTELGHRVSSSDYKTAFKVQTVY